ncbi:MAG TPA: HutD family protein [Bacteriovoracaceae bacterium]|nr:HutD family protein [Bacteriovoracaceae bacterium]
MARKIEATSFKEMAWKNGGGKTRELFAIPHPEKMGAFLFRLSAAQVESDGPFSFFPDIDRALLLLGGDGFILKLTGDNRREIRLDEKLSPIYFAGEEKIECKLINGICQDFNVMIDRNYGKVMIEIIQEVAPTLSLVSDGKLFIVEVDKSRILCLHLLDEKEHFIVLGPRSRERTLIKIELFVN